MPQRLPFEAIDGGGDEHRSGAPAQCPIHNILPPELRTEAEQAPHLMAYLHKVPMADYGVPAYYPQISRKLGDLEDPNLIYPVGSNTFIHVFPDGTGGAELYIAIEPTADRMDEYVEDIEYRLLDFVELLADAHTAEEKTAVILRAIDDSVELTDRPSAAPAPQERVAAGEAGFLKLPFGSKTAGGSSGGGGKIRVNSAELESRA